MSRKYMNDRWCVRCGKESPTPFVEKWARSMWFESPEGVILDIGCGNGRNSKYVHNEFNQAPVSVDMCNDYGVKCILGHDKLPVKTKSVSFVLASYVLMFLNEKELSKLCKELNRVCMPGCKILVEMYPAKDSECKTPDACQDRMGLFYSSLDRNKWVYIGYWKNRVILQRRIN